MQQRLFRDAFDISPCRVAAGASQATVQNHQQAVDCMTGMLAAAILFVLSCHGEQYLTQSELSLPFVTT